MKIVKTLKLRFFSVGWMPKTGERLMQLQDCNVILVDYGSLSKCSYIYLAGIVVSDIGKYLAKCIEQWNLPLAQTQLIGFSLGAHICGVVGCTLDGKISKIIGKSLNINFV